MPKMDVRLSYTIDNRDNQSPRNAYSVDTRSNTSTSANGDCTALTGLCLNLPYSFEHQTFTAEAGYRILPQTKVTLNDTFETTFRSYADASFVTSNTVTAKIRSQLTDNVFGSFSYSHQDRVANNYANDNTWSLLGTTLTEPTGMLIYFEASRRHDELKGTLDVSPTHNMTASLMAKFSNDVYPGDQYGLRNNHNFSIGPDVSWDITPAIISHAYYTYQQIYYDQANLYVSGTNYSATGTGYYVPWTANTTDSVQTFGLTTDWQAIKDVLKFSFDYNLSYGDTAYALGDGMALIGGGITSPTTIRGAEFPVAARRDLDAEHDTDPRRIHVPPGHDRDLRLRVREVQLQGLHVHRCSDAVRQRVAARHAEPERRDPRGRRRPAHPVLKPGGGPGRNDRFVTGRSTAVLGCYQHGRTEAGAWYHEILAIWRYRSAASRAIILA